MASTTIGGMGWTAPHRLELYVEAEQGTLFPCPDAARLLAHDFSDKIWRHLNLFQHHCYLHARVLRIRRPEHRERVEAS